MSVNQYEDDGSFVVGRSSTREQAIEEFKKWRNDNPEISENLQEGDVILEIVRGPEGIDFYQMKILKFHR